MSNKMILFDKVYDGESIVDTGRDISEALDVNYSIEMARIPVDIYGFPKGKFLVRIEWEGDE